MPDGPHVQSRRRKPILTFLFGAIAATCLILGSQWVLRELESWSKIRGPYERVTWDATMAEPPPDDFLFAMFPVGDGPIPSRVMLNTLREVQSEEPSYELFDPMNPGHFVPRDELAFTASFDELPRCVKAFNDANRSWGDGYRDCVIQIDVRATEGQVAVMLELRFGEGKLERYEYTIEGDQAVPLSFTQGLWKYVPND